MVSSNQLFIRVLKEGSSFFNDLPRLKRGHCIWPVVTGKDNNLKLSIACGCKMESP